MPQIVSNTAEKASLRSGSLSTRCLFSLSDSVPQTALGGESAFVIHLSPAASPRGSGAATALPQRADRGRRREQPRGPGAAP